MQAAVVSTSSTSGGRLPARAAGVSRRSLRDLLNHRRASGGLLRARAGGGFETVAARPPQPPRNRSQPTGGNPIASPPLTLTGAVNPPTRPQRRHPCLTAPVRVRHSAFGLPQPTKSSAWVGGFQRRLRWSRQARPAAGGFQRRAAGVSRRSLRDLLNHRRASGVLLRARAGEVSRRSLRDLLNHRGIAASPPAATRWPARQCPKQARCAQRSARLSSVTSPCRRSIRSSRLVRSTPGPSRKMTARVPGPIVAPSSHPTTAPTSWTVL